MKAEYIHYKDTRHFSDTIIRLLENDEQLKPFINQSADLKGFEKIISERKFKGSRETLVNVLKKQYQESDISNIVRQNINSLERDSTFTITTGHQLNIFTGPLYFIFKIVTAINLANDLKKQFPDYDFVPTYWMATEDHDFEEINHLNIGGKVINWDLKASGATGRLSTDSILSALNAYKGILGISENAERLQKIVTKAYSAGNTLSQATRSLVNDLFGEHGLVIIDADDHSLKTQFAPIMVDDIIHENSYRNISSSNQQLKDIGIQAQVNPREINFFYLTDGLRERIVYEEERYQVLNAGISFSEEELRIEINRHPERFSPNVVMRPLYQEVILPNIAYVGGAGELAYWLQLKSNFEFYKVDYPLLILRNSALITVEKVASWINRLNISTTAIFKSSEELKKDFLLHNSIHQLDLNNEWHQIQAIFESLKERAGLIDPTLKPSTLAVEIRLRKALENLERKLIKADKRNHAEAMVYIDKIKAELFPNGGLQERNENFGLFYVKYGDDFLNGLIKSFHPLDFKFTILFP